MANLAAIVDRLRRDRSFVADRLASAVRRELPDYAALPQAAVAEAIGVDLDGFVDLLAEGRAPTGPDAQRSLDVARARARSGFSAAVFLESLNVARREAFALVEELGGELGAGVADRRHVEGVISNWIGMLMVQATRAFLELSRGEGSTQAEREALLRSLLNGELDAALQRRAALFGVRASARYRAFAARPGPASTAWDVAHAVARTGSRGNASSLVAEFDDRVVGIVVQMPRPEDVHVTLGLGPPVHLSEIRSSYAEACRVLEAGVSLDRSGVLTLDDVAFETAVLEDARRSEALAARCVEPLLPDGPSGVRVLDTVETWLERGGSVQETADALAVHPNTVRYRLQVYADRTGETLDDFQARCRVWWALRWRRARPVD